MSDIRYKVAKSRIDMSLLEGFEYDTQGGIDGVRSVLSIINGIVFYPFDSGEEDGVWGRLKFDVRTSENTAYYVFVVATNNYVDFTNSSFSDAKRQLVDMGAKRYVNFNDILLYDLYGQYLYVAVQVVGEEINFSIKNMVIDRVGDNFMNTFPVVFRERNSFFHRYMSVLSSVYNDLDEKIADLPKLLDLDTCPAQLLNEYGRWLGIDLGDGVFEEDIMRSLVKEAYQLNRMKGSRRCLERIVEIFLGTEGIIVERNQLSDVFSPSQLEEYNKIYGESQQDVTLLLQIKLPQAKRNQLEFLLEQFLPVRCKMHIIELGQLSGLDSHIYLDVNAQIFNPTEASLDEDGSLNDNLILM